MDYTCDKLSDKVMTTEDWKKKHLTCMSDYEADGFKREPFPHPSGEWQYLICPCGAKHVCGIEGGQS